jgi:ribose transport system ATP-binding protein
MKKEVILKCINIKKSFGIVQALKGIDFDLYKGEIHALVGENGAGKSTLMHILAGVYKMDSGTIKVDDKNTDLGSHMKAYAVGISIVFQERSLLTNLTIAENIFVDRVPVNKLNLINWKKLNADAKKILDKLELNISPETPVSQITVAEQQMVEIAKAMSMNFKVLILDEPTATITSQESEVLFEIVRKLAKQGISIIYISHRLEEIKKIADRVTIFKDGSCVGTYNVYEISLDEIISKMIGHELSGYGAEGKNKSTNAVLKLKNFSGKGFSNINLELEEGEILTLAGLSGAGGTEIALSIFGVNPPKSGEMQLYGKEIKIDSPTKAMKNGIGYLPKDRKECGLFLDMMVWENIEAPNIYKLSNGLLLSNKNRFRVTEEYRDKLRIDTPSIRQRLLNLSGGNQQKVSLAKWLLYNPRILIIDEPTRGIDVGAKVAIYRILDRLASEEGISIIIISSEIIEILSVGNRIAVLFEGKIMGILKRRDANEELITQLASGIKSFGKVESKKMN